MIEFDRVYKLFGSFPALKGATFKVPRGVLAGLLGPNGAGKTTSLKLIVGLLKPEGGRISVAGYDPWRDEDAVKPLIGFLPERPVYPPYVRVGVLLRHLAKLRGLPYTDVVRIADLVGIKDKLDLKVGELSRGFLQRLGLAQTLLGEPEILLLDEPTANLDPHARMEILELIAALKRDLDATVIVSSHILPELQQVVDYIVLISRGSVAEYGPLEEVSRKYRVGMVYRVDTPKPRVLSKRLIDVECVNGLIMHGGWVEVHVDAACADEVRDIFSSLRGEGLVLDYNMKTGYLGELYDRAIKAHTV